MKLPGYRRILKADVPDSPDWLPSLLNPLNLFLERVTRIFEKGISFDDNIDCKRYKVRINTAIGLVIDLQGRKVNGLIITKVEPHAAFSPVWQVEGDTLRVGPWTGIPAGDHDVEFIVF